VFFVAGFVAGCIRETCVILYYKSIHRRAAWLGSGLGLLIALIDLFVIARLAWDKDVALMAGYILGEALGTNLSIRYGR
jgi:hypothetical protein